MVNVKIRGKKMKILILTGKLASGIVGRVTSESEHQVHTLTINTPIAAFLTPKRIIQELEKLELEYLTSFEMIITPGLIRKDVSPVEEKTGLPT